jgi:hypothetical protein
VTLNSVELSKIDLQPDGRICLDLPEFAIRKLDHGQAVLRVTLAPCAPEVGCGPAGNHISRIRIEEV